jgi:hypothetical protein
VDRPSTEPLDRLPVRGDDGDAGSVAFDDEFVDVGGVERVEGLESEVDDVGLLPVEVETAEALCRVVDAAYEKRSIPLSSNLHPAGFDELMPKTIANATVDRLLHHAHAMLTAGDSIWLTQATAGKGVTPLER